MFNARLLLPLIPVGVPSLRRGPMKNPAHGDPLHSLDVPTITCISVLIPQLWYASSETIHTPLFLTTENRTMRTYSSCLQQPLIQSSLLFLSELLASCLCENFKQTIPMRMTLLLEVLMLNSAMGNTSLDRNYLFYITIFIMAVTYVFEQGMNSIKV